MTGNGQMGLVVSADIDLRLFLGGWASVFAIEEQTGKGTQRSIQVFDRQGTAVHKVFLTEDSQLQAWEPLLERFAASEQCAELDLQPLPLATPAQADAVIDANALRVGWSSAEGYPPLLCPAEEARHHPYPGAASGGARMG